MKTPVIDLFAGPGGLSEGFAAYTGATSFDVVLSVEKDDAAHKTLELRSFFRQFPKGKAPEAYYDYIRGSGSCSREQLFDRQAEQRDAARRIAYKATLGTTPLREVLKKIDDALGTAEQWALLGGPPCQAYSIIGRARMKGSNEFANDHRHTLYREYLKIVAAYQPTIFVMENVKGILSSKHRDEAIFGRILADLRDPWGSLRAADKRLLPTPRSRHGYRIFSFVKSVTWEEELEPNDFIIESERFGVPQKRHRVILLGIREDVNLLPSVLECAAAEVSVRDILQGLPKIRSRLSSGETDTKGWIRAINDGRSAFRSGMTVELSDRIRRSIDSLTEALTPGGRFIPGIFPPVKLRNWLFDERLRGVVQHESRSHMASDLHRYMFASCYAEKYSRSPKLDDFPKKLMPNHANAVPDSSGRIEDFCDRFRVQMWGQASTTVTAHISKDGHYFIHPDPTQCRALTVREAARLQTFPDNYFFEGNRTQQYQQIGNAVPPFLAYQLADVVAEILAAKTKCAGTGALVNVRQVAS